MINRLSPRGSAAAAPLPSTSARSSSNNSSSAVRVVAAARPTRQTPLAARPRSSRTNQSKIPAIENDTVLSAAAASADAAQPIYDVNDPVVTAAFSLATVALTILTLGVAYLSITGWIDSRNEEAERKRVEAAERSR